MEIELGFTEINRNLQHFKLYSNQNVICFGRCEVEKTTKNEPK